jgi:hypothetical protein
MMLHVLTKIQNTFDISTREENKYNIYNITETSKANKRQIRIVEKGGNIRLPLAFSTYAQPGDLYKAQSEHKERKDKYDGLYQA